MTLYEVGELINGGNANLMSSQATFLSIVTAYLVVAYTVGEKLTRFQVVFVNTVFVLSMLNGIFGAQALMAILNEYLQEKQVILGNEDGLSDARTLFTSTIFIGIRAILLVGSLMFMWSVRHPRDD